MLILCLELIRGRLGVMSAEIRKLFFIILTTLIEKSPVSITQLHYLLNIRLVSIYGSSTPALQLPYSDLPYQKLCACL